jgi:hypothetical protein
MSKMSEVGSIPNEISMLKALNSIGENIIIADKQFVLLGV